MPVTVHGRISPIGPTLDLSSNHDAICVYGTSNSTRFETEKSEANVEALVQDSAIPRSRSFLCSGYFDSLRIMSRFWLIFGRIPLSIRTRFQRGTQDIVHRFG